MDKIDGGREKASNKCYELFEKSGKVGYYMLYNALKDIEEDQ